MYLDYWIIHNSSLKEGRLCFITTFQGICRLDGGTSAYKAEMERKTTVEKKYSVDCRGHQTAQSFYRFYAQ